jgi:UDP-3-O-acyl-N-acetylglucosamine deacetylase
VGMLSFDNCVEVEVQEIEMNLADEAADKFSHLFQAKGISNNQYRKTVDNMEEIIEQYGGMVRLCLRVIAETLEQDTGTACNNET